MRSCRYLHCFQPYPNYILLLVAEQKCPTAWVWEATITLAKGGVGSSPGDRQTTEALPVSAGHRGEICAANSVSTPHYDPRQSSFVHMQACLFNFSGILCGVSSLFYAYKLPLPTPYMVSFEYFKTRRGGSYCQAVGSLRPILCITPR